MTRYIDADEAYAVLSNYYHRQTEIQHEALREALGRVPTVDTVKHGHWLDDGQRLGNNNECAIHECDQCGETVYVYLNDPRRWNYCPKCGAKMYEEILIKLRRKE